jgi:hypothetical protein
MTPPENHHTFAMPLLPYRAGTGEVAPVEVRDPRAKAASGILSLGGHAHVQHLRLTGSCCVDGSRDQNSSVRCFTTQAREAIEDAEGLKGQRSTTPGSWPGD